MNLERLLAENMIRFGTKNLSERDQLKLLKEAIGAPPAMTNPNPIVQEFITNNTIWGPNFKQQVNSVTNLLNKYSPAFSNATNAEAAPWIAFAHTAAVDYTQRNEFRKGIKSIEKLQALLESLATPIDNWDSATIIQLNESPDAPGKVLTVGNVTSQGVNGTDPGNASDYTEIIKYLNDFNIGNIAATDWTATRNGAYTAQIDINPFKMSPGLAGSAPKNIASGTSFIPGDPKKTPGAGSLDIEESYDDISTDAIIYSTQQYKAASAKSDGKQINTITYTPGPEVTAPLPSNLFPVLGITLNPDAAPVIAQSIADMKKLGTITAVRVESGASYDRPIDLDQAGFAAKLGLQPNQVPADPRADAEGTVTDPMSGGNAFLAYQRGQAIMKAIGNTAGVTPTIKAEVKTGGDAAQYAKLIFTIKKADSQTTITDDDLKSIGAASSTTQLAGMMQMVKLKL